MNKKLWILILILIAIVFISYNLKLEYENYEEIINEQADLNVQTNTDSQEIESNLNELDENMGQINDPAAANQIAPEEQDELEYGANGEIDYFDLSVNENSEVFTRPLKITEDKFHIQELEDGTRYIVNPKDIVGGGPPKDGIPSIDNPKYVTVAEADEWIQDNELILALEYKGVKRVYPLQIMVWHEIVNDFIAGDPVLITYCPLCGSGIAFERVIDGKAVEFGTSGKLYNSNLVMYDRATDTYWQQIDGVAIVGEHVGLELNDISIDTLVWRDYKKVHNDAAVLSQDTGHSRNYGRDPYGNYYENTFLFFDVEERNDIIHPKTPVIGIEVDGRYKAYREKDVRELKRIEDTVNGVDIALTADEVGFIKIKNTQTNEEIIKERDFWFAWYAFHPDTQLYEVKNE